MARMMQMIIRAAALASAAMLLPGDRLALTPRVDRTSLPPRGYRTIDRLNRSRHWPFAHSYRHARELSPSAEPVR